MTRAIHVIGLSAEKNSRLSRPAEQALLSADTIIGSKRQLAALAIALAPALLASKRQLQLPRLSELHQMISQCSEPGELVILASGDPHYFGIGRWLGQNCEDWELHFYPAVSSIQSVCNRLGLSLQDCDVISLHGRDPRELRRRLKKNRILVVLTDQFSHPRALAHACIEAGFADSRIHVGEDLGTSGERYREFSVSGLVSDETLEFSDLHVSVIQVQGEGGTLPEFPGIPDKSFVTDGAPGQGMLTKREVRLAILALLQPASGDLIWDIGAGCGGVSIELAFWNAGVTVYAVEQSPARFACLTANQDRFGVISNLHLIQARAPDALEDLPDATKAFIGGSGGELDSILAPTWSRLPVGGILVVSSVTSATLERLTAFALDLHRDQVESIRVLVSKGDTRDTDIEFQDKLPVTVFKFTKMASLQ